MKGPSVSASNGCLLVLIAAAFWLGVMLVASCCLGGCKALDDYDRRYTLEVSDGQQSVAASATLRPRKPYANELRVPPSLDWKNPDLFVP